jgi:glycosyltransferase involved in cell wall biosynthesis
MVSRSPSEPPVILDARVVRGAGGGPDKTILKSPRFLLPAGYRMLCAYMHAPDDAGFAHLFARAARWEAPLRSVPDRGPLDFRVVTRLLDLCRRERVAVWHGHDYKSNLLGLLLRRLWPMRLVTTVHGWVDHTGRTPLYYWVDRLCLPRYEHVLCVSPDLHQQCLAAGVPAGRCMLLENGIDVDEFARRRSPAEAKRDAGHDPGRLLIGAVGRLSAEKGFDVLLRAVARLVREGLDVELVVLGEGQERSALGSLAAELGLHERVRLAGYVGDPRPLYEAMDVFALSSLREGLPNVLLEALSMEVPAVATRIAGVPRLLRDGDNGLLVEPGSVEGLAAALGRLLRDAGLRRRLAQAGRATVARDYSFAARMTKLADLYDSLLGRRPGAERDRGATAGLALR